MTWWKGDSLKTLALGADTAVTAIRVVWPGGASVDLPNPQIDATIEVGHPGGNATAAGANTTGGAGSGANPAAAGGSKVPSSGKGGVQA